MEFINSSSCGYIGKSIRHLATQVRELDTSPSAVHEHLSSYDVCKLTIHVITFQLLIWDKNDYEIIVKEALHIKYKKNPQGLISSCVH